jgi:hypothetical protein
MNRQDELNLETGYRAAALLSAGEVKALGAIYEAASVGLQDATNEQLGIVPGIAALLVLRGLVTTWPVSRGRAGYRLTPLGVATIQALVQMGRIT